MLKTLELNPQKTALRSIIWLHGLGADAHDFESIVPQLGLQEELQLRFIFPNAPVMPVTINRGIKMPAWFDIYEARIDSKIDMTGIANSKAAIEQLIDNEKKRGIDPKNIMLAGFSQGAVMTLIVGLQYPETLAGLIALSGFLPKTKEILPLIAPQNKKTPIFIAHGTADPIVPYPLGLQTFENLLEANLNLTWHSYYMPHTVSQEEIFDIKKWMQQCFRPTTEALI